ncbi:ABC transporter ATP-binding protein [Gracilibacillus alcaliphilus]|uniref:ABC transporter ATP-binding protein n=1 Tax=Gracilibacillus alcaliphilus TaxID=1401441 RepID=UPI0019578D9B|nr:ABC transporter ATP-binding protein [Gracilibacillus alcaliphilus]MBM7678120.1 peptide/nickel transport system ATP-binding protein [Gracilibacillus alcaliphilus]
MVNLLEINNLCIDYDSPRGKVKAVHNVSFTIKKGEIFGLVGESGCGKSTTAFGISRLLRPPAQISAGSITLNGQELTHLSEAEFDKLRWSHISIVLQSAMNNLNPVIKIQEQLIDAILAHKAMSAEEAINHAKYLLRLVDINEERLANFPHELSGGMRQRVVIAMALALQPDLIIMDEPTTALDVVVQNGIIHKILELQKDFGFSILFITHDLPLMLEICDRIGVMYAGELVEVTKREDLMEQARHPYTQGLLESFPPLKGEKRRLKGISGHPPDLVTPPDGCSFHPRCPYAMLQCKQKEPEKLHDNKGIIACHLYQEGGHRFEQLQTTSEGTK